MKKINMKASVAILAVLVSVSLPITLFAAGNEKSSLKSKPTVNVTSIEKLDTLAKESGGFSFTIISDTKGATGGVTGTALNWIRANGKFCIGNGDLFNGNNDSFDDVMSDPDDYFHNKFYPVVGDHDNEILINGVKGTEKAWGRAAVVFDLLGDFKDRPNVEFRKPLPSKVLSGGVYYDDRYVDYYATETHGKFTVHIIAAYKGDKSVFAKRSADFMYNKVVELSASKTRYDIIILVAHDERWFQRSRTDWNIWDWNEIDFMLKNTDLIVCASDHRFRRVHELDGRVANQALITDSGIASNGGITDGYLDIHVFDNPPRFTVQYIDCEYKSSRALHDGANWKYMLLPDRGEKIDHMHPMMKYVNGGIVQPLDWNNFPYIPAKPDSK